MQVKRKILVFRQNAFDTDEELQKLRAEYEAEKKVFKYDWSVRAKMNNSLGMSDEDLKGKIGERRPLYHSFKSAR